MAKITEAINNLGAGLNSTGEGAFDVARGMVIASANIAQGLERFGVIASENITRGLERQGAVAAEKLQTTLFWVVGGLAASFIVFKIWQQERSLWFAEKRMLADQRNEALERDHQLLMLDTRIKNPEPFQRQERVHTVGQPSSSMRSDSDPYMSQTKTHQATVRAVLEGIESPN